MELDYEFNPNDLMDFSADVIAKNGEVVKDEKEVKETKEEEDKFDEESLLTFEEIAEEEEVKNTETKPHSPETKAESSSSPNHWLVFAKSLEESGLLSEFTDEQFNQIVEEVGSPSEAIIQMANKTIEKTINEHIESQDNDYKEFVKFRDLGVDMNEYAKISKQAKGYDSYTVESIRSDEDLQKEVVRQHLTLKGMDKDEIDETIESLEDTGKLGKRAEAALENLKKFKYVQLAKLEEETKNGQIARENAVKEQLSIIRKSVDDVTEIVPGVKLSKQHKDKLYDMITKPVAVIDGQQVNAITEKMMKNPTAFNLKLAELIRLGIFDDKWDAITKVQKTKAINELEKVIESGVAFKSGGGYSNNPTYKDLKELNEKYKK